MDQLGIFGLTLIGFALIVLDLLFIPGGFVVALGVVAIFASIYQNYQANGLVPALIHTALCMALVPKLITWSLGRVALKKVMSAEDGYVSLESRSRYIGLEGEVLSDLRPSGTVLIREGETETRLDCIASEGYIARGETVVVFEERGPSLVVRRA